MKPIVVLDTNALFGRSPLTSANSLMVQALSNSGQISLVLPDVVLQELARQLAEKSADQTAKIVAATRALNETLEELGEPEVAVVTPSVSRDAFYKNAKSRFVEKKATVLCVPEVSIASLLARDLDVKKPFDRDGKGFRDALIWESISGLCNTPGRGSDPILFVTQNYTDFGEKRGGRLHPDLAGEIPHNVDVRIISTLHELLQSDVVKPLVVAHRRVEPYLDPQKFEELVDVALAELYGRDVQDAVGIYIGSGLYDYPVTTAADGSTFDEIIPDFETLDYSIFGDGNAITVRITVEADCSFDGFVDKATYYVDNGDRYVFHEDWNNHSVRVGTYGRVTFVLSGTVYAGEESDLVLSLDEAHDAA